MKIADRTPFRNSSGQIDLPGRLQGTLKYGMAWYPQMQAEDALVAILNKTLGANYILLRNITLSDTAIDLPLVLIGPPGVYMINVAYEHGLFIVRDDEWGKMSGEFFVPARVNLVQRTVKLARVLQLYLDRAGYKGLIVEPVLMAVDPAIHIDPTRPAARIVLNDAIDRFAVSLTQASAILKTEMVAEIGLAIAKGQKKSAPGSANAVTVVMPASTEQESLQKSNPPEQQQPFTPAFTPDSLDFSFDDKQADPQAPFVHPASNQNETIQQTSTPASSNQDYSSFFDTSNQAFIPDEPEPSALPETIKIERSQPESLLGSASPSATSAPKKNNRLGMSRTQLLTLAGILIFWCCIMAGFIYYINR